MNFSPMLEWLEVFGGLLWKKIKDKINIEQVVHQVGYINISYIKLGTIKLTCKEGLIHHLYFNISTRSKMNVVLPSGQDQDGL